MRDFADSIARPFSQAKDDDLVNLISNIIGGKLDPNKDERLTEPNSDEEKPKEEDEKVDGKSRAFQNAVNRLATRKAKKETETEGYLREFSEASIENIAIILAETLTVEQLEELCTLLNYSNEN
tara:strand:- start:7814 stop:8185 length:372 start_codon:yes stop_codon:yes gene_type:complete